MYLFWLKLKAKEKPIAHHTFTPFGFIVVWQYNLRLRYAMCWFGTHIHCKMTTIIKLVNIFISFHNYYFLMCVLIFQIYSLNNFQVYSALSLTIVTVLCIIYPQTYLPYNWKFVPSDHLHPFCRFPQSLPPCLWTINLFSVSRYSFLFFSSPVLLRNNRCKSQ